MKRQPAYNEAQERLVRARYCAARDAGHAWGCALYYARLTTLSMLEWCHCGVRARVIAARMPAELLARLPPSALTPSEAAEQDHRRAVALPFANAL